MADALEFFHDCKEKYGEDDYDEDDDEEDDEEDATDDDLMWSLENEEEFWYDGEQICRLYERDVI